MQKRTFSVTRFDGCDSSCVDFVEVVEDPSCPRLNFGLKRNDGKVQPYTYEVDAASLKRAFHLAEAVQLRIDNPYVAISPEASWGKFHASIKANFGKANQ